MVIVKINTKYGNVIFNVKLMIGYDALNYQIYLNYIYTNICLNISVLD